MTNYYIEPEVAGGLGENTVGDFSVHPPQISKLHYQLDGWLGDDLLESFPCFIVTERLKEAIVQSRLSGVEFNEVEITKSEQFDELYPNKTLPKFYWMIVSRIDSENDIALAADGRLIVSGKALEVLQAYQIDNADIEEITE